MNTRQAVVVGAVFVVSIVVLTLILGLVFSSFAASIGPAIAVSAGIGLAAWFGIREKF